MKITFSKTNPKKKGYRKVKFIERNCKFFAILNKQEYVLCNTEFRVLMETGLKDGDFFWLKGKVIV